MKLNSIVKTSLLAAALISSGLQAKPVYVATTAIVEHPALDAVRDGIKSVLDESKYKGDELKFTYESAQGQPAIAAQIARKLVGEQPDVIVAIATPSAQAAVSVSRDIPVVFSAVTDPIGAKLVPTLEQPGGNVTGLSDMVNVKQHIELIKEFIPNLKTLGVPYNPGEANSVSSVAALKAAAAEMGIKVIESAAPKSSDVMIATKQLVGKVDAIYCPIDNTIISAVESVIKVGIDAQIPVFAGDTDTVSRGAVAAVGYNYFDLGRQTGDIVVSILDGEKPGAIDVKLAKGTDLFVNPKMAARMGVTVPESVLTRATKVIK
ncbi:ABC transporter substrate-binding protein [Psychromonas sp. 14N.309.X.WAT.B.A12]|uniref:ABC transporter substrate-binding protein n=1 Tax=unclassified Psychromonas TaxID=2614957 RepID=UPI0025B0A4A2|nr:ABC transporter substrate-binding protein [Psychromonas sp. 14N.309.X.WAT.B.A12]MDN2664954.1 ABC transporter substrate-binding protein [Psychromonas sp. 14N.309.X.WAT.B.A12]